jgi:site-specific recombinase XerD
MDTTSLPPFHPSSLVKAKGKWYVVVTKPAELVVGLTKQVKRSTGTSDKRVAAAIQHKITSEIYQGFIEALTPPPETLIDVLKEYWTLEGMSEHEMGLKTYELDHEGRGRITACTRAWRKSGRDPLVIDRLIQHLGYKDAVAVRRAVDPYQTADPYIASTEAVQAPVVALPEPDAQTPVVGIERAVETYHKDKAWNRDATRLKSHAALRAFIEFTGVKYVDEVIKPHAYRFASDLSDRGFANGTIKTQVSAVRGFLSHCERMELIQANPFTELNLSSYGAKKVHYRPFKDDELKMLFKQDMSAEARLTFSILIATGMRLDEVALLDMRQVRQHGEGFTYLDLTDDALVKNTGSQRLIPLHPAIKLPTTKAGRLFSYKLNSAGKAQMEASRKLNPIVRLVSNDSRLVVHSLRGSFKDMLRNFGVSKEINDFITGHSQGDSASNYGSGPSISVRYDAIKDLDLSFMVNQ